MDDTEAITLARGKFEDGLRLLRESVEILRGPQIPPSPSAMRTEQALSRAIEALQATGFMPAVPVRKA